MLTAAAVGAARRVCGCKAWRELIVNVEETVEDNRGRCCCRAEELVGAMKADVELRRRASRGMVAGLMGAMIILYFCSADWKMLWCVMVCSCELRGCCFGAIAGSILGVSRVWGRPNWRI